VRKRLAKLIALRCFRNTYLEHLHAGKVPHTKTGDYTDVRIVDAEREIPWNELSRLSDREMKTLMIEVVDRCYDFLTTLCEIPAGDELIAQVALRDPVPKWYDPLGSKTQQRNGQNDAETTVAY